MTVADGMLWVLASGTVVRIDPATNTVVGKPLRVPADAAAIAVGDRTLWVATVAPGDLGTPHKDAVTHIDLATGRTVATITVGRAPLDIAATPGAVWVTNAGGGGDSVARIDPRTNRLVGRPVRTGASPQSFAIGGGSLWVANHDAGTVTRIELASGKVLADIPVPSEPHRVAYGAAAAWVGNWHDDSVSRIDLATNRVVGSPIPIGFHAGNLVVGAGGVWVTSDYRQNAAAEDVAVVRIDPRPTGRSRRSRSAVTRWTSRPLRVRSGCRSPTPARSCGSPRAKRPPRCPAKHPAWRRRVALDGPATAAAVRSSVPGRVRVRLGDGVKAAGAQPSPAVDRSVMSRTC